MTISWDEYFMGVSLLSAFRSKDPNTPVGACIVNEDKRIVAVGYNGMPQGCNDNDFPWQREGDFLENKYTYVVHAELNAVLNTTSSLKNCTLYVSLFPCNECCKAIIQSGISKIVYLSDKYNGEPSDVAAKRMLNAAGVNYAKMVPNIESLPLSFVAL